MRELLSHEETMALLERSQAGDEGATEQLVSRNMGLVRSIVKKFTGRGVEYDDLMQIGSVGLLKAITNFDTSYSVRFSTYAVPMIAGEIKRFLRDDGMVKVSRSLKERAAAIAAAGEELKTKLRREPTVAELAEATGLSPEDVAAAETASQSHVSLNEYMYDDDVKRTQYIDMLTCEDGEARIESIMLRELLMRLPERERALIVQRFFLDRTQSEIASDMGVSQVQVSRLIAKTIERMRREVE